MKDNPISVVIPLYNKASTIVRCLDSVLAQDNPPEEVIVMDDGSLDNGLEIVKNYQSQHPALNLRVLFQNNQGVAAARNAGIKAAKCDFVALLDADDTYEPKFVHEIKSLITAFPSARVFCTHYAMQYQDGTRRNARWVGLKQKPRHGLMKRYFKMAAQGDLPISASSVCIHKRAINRAGGFPHGQQMGEDQWLWSILALNETIAYSARSLANYHIQTVDSLMQTVVPEQELPYSAMLQDLIDTGRFTSQQKRDIRAMIRTHLFDLIRRNFQTRRLSICQTLLNDPRLKVWHLKTVYWRIKITAAYLNRHLSNRALNA